LIENETLYRGTAATYRFWWVVNEDGTPEKLTW